MALTKVSTPAIKDEAITLAKLLHGDSNSNGKFLRANNGADPTFETVNTDLVSDTSPQLGGDLSSNGNDIIMADNDSIKLGNSTDFIMFHDNAGHTYLQDQGNGALRIRSDSEVAIQKWDGSTNENMAKFLPDAAVELYHNNDKKLETSSIGVNIFGDSTVGVNNNTQANLHFTSPSDNASARYSRIRKNYNSPFNMEYFASTSSSAQNHVFYSNLSTEVVRIQGSGGISFNGDTAAANALDDYEEGTFSPFTSTQISTHSISIPAQAHYIKIGRMCYIWFRMSFSSSNNTAIEGNMPFPCSNPTSSGSDSPFFLPVFPRTNATPDMGFAYLGSNGTTGFTIYQSNANYATFNFNSGLGQLVVAGCYRTT